MSEPTTIRGYHQLLAVMRARKEALGMSDKDLEHIAELTPGHWSKIIAGTKSLGPLSLGRILRALSLELVAQEDKDGAARVQELYLPRAESQVRERKVMANATTFARKWLLNSRKARKLRQIQLSRFTPEQRSRIAKKAARNRWKRERQKRRVARQTRLAKRQATSRTPSIGTTA